MKNKTWIYEKFKRDMAIYAICPECGFHHSPSKYNTKTNQNIITYQYNYCPICGIYLFNKNLKEEIEVIWNKRDILEIGSQNYTIH